MIEAILPAIGFAIFLFGIFMFKLYQKMKKSYLEVIEIAESALERNELLLEYCLGRIQEDAIQSEDYEKAKECMELLKQLTPKDKNKKK